MTLIDTFVRGIPKGQPRPRAFARNGKARVYDPGTAEHWKSSIAFTVGQQVPACVPLSVHLVFHLPRPKHHYGKNGVLKSWAPRYQYGKPDADNLAKAVLDALTIVGVWKDDAQVAELVVLKWYDRGLGPGCHIKVSTIESGDV